MAFGVDPKAGARSSVPYWSQIGPALGMFSGPATFYFIMGGAPSGDAAWPTANLILYYPILVPYAISVAKVGYCSAPTGTENIQLGIYDRAGKRVGTTGTVAHSASTAYVTVALSATVGLAPDLYYMALQDSGVTNTYRRVAPGTTGLTGGAGVRREAAGAFGLPATATWTVDNTNQFVVPLSIVHNTVL